MLLMFEKYSLSVSPTNVWQRANVVTDFILDEHSNF